MPHINYKFPGSFDLRVIGYYCLVSYTVFLLFSVALAHIVYEIDPYSGWSERLIAPLRNGLEFLDEHWKAALIMIAPFFVSEIRGMIRRVNEVAIGGNKITMVPIGTYEKPNQSTSEEAE